MSNFSSTTIRAIQEAVTNAGVFALNNRSQAVIQYKADETPFTDLELNMEELLVNFIQEQFPGDQIITEETGIKGEVSPRIWALDPIDGTKIYLNGLPTWCVSLGLIEENVPSLGWIYMPATGDLIWGGPEVGAWHNNHRLVSDQPFDINHPLVFLGIPANAQKYYDINYSRARSFGSTAVHLAYLATGAAIGVLTRHINLWDIAGILPILQETGVEVSFFSGNPLIPANYLNGEKFPEEILAARPQHMTQLRSLIKRK